MLVVAGVCRRIQRQVRSGHRVASVNARLQGPRGVV